MSSENLDPNIHRIPATVYARKTVYTCACGSGGTALRSNYPTPQPLVNYVIIMSNAGPLFLLFPSPFRRRFIRRVVVVVVALF